MTNDCGILNFLEPGDEIMADRSFGIEDDLLEDDLVGVSLNLPPFLNDQKQFSEDEKTIQELQNTESKWSKLYRG